MSKKHSDKLYKLVKSLSTAEKRYFKVIANKKGDASNKYNKKQKIFRTKGISL